MSDTSYTIHYIVTSEHAYTLVNWKEIEEWYKLPFYKKWFIKKPIKELKRLNQNKDENRTSNNNASE